MSGPSAVQAVSATLKKLLTNSLSAHNGQVKVVAAPPPQDAKPPNARQLNLFLYRVAESPHLKNQEIPGEGHPGGGYGHPPLSLELSYLLTAYADTEDEEGDHLLLGEAMRVLHDNPIVYPGLIAGEPAEAVLHADLADAFEHIKVTLDPVSLEDLTKVWTALNTPYRVCAAYKVTVVQIESERQRRLPRPVGEPQEAGPRIEVVQIRRPHIDELLVGRQGGGEERRYPYARLNDALVIRGSSLVAEATRVLIGSVDASSAITSLRDDRIAVTIPWDPGLRPGAHTVRVVHDVHIGDSDEPRIGASSNLAVFVLVPHVKSATVVAADIIRVEGSHLYDEDQECLTFIGEHRIEGGLYAASSYHAAIEFPRPEGLAAGNYAVRVWVNGAESIDAATLRVEG